MWTLKEMQNNTITEVKRWNVPHLSKLFVLPVELSMHAMPKLFLYQGKAFMLVNALKRLRAEFKQ